MLEKTVEVVKTARTEDAKLVAQRRRSWKQRDRTAGSVGGEAIL